MATLSDTRPYLSRLAGIVTLGPASHAYAGYTVAYTDYAATITRAGRTYPVATITEYPDGHVLIWQHHALNATARGAWRAMHECLGFPVEPYRAPATYCTRPTL